MSIYMDLVKKYPAILFIDSDLKLLYVQ